MSVKIAGFPDKHGPVSCQVYRMRIGCVKDAYRMHDRNRMDPLLRSPMNGRLLEPIGASRLQISRWRLDPYASLRGCSLGRMPNTFANAASASEGRTTEVRSDYSIFDKSIFVPLGNR